MLYLDAFYLLSDFEFQYTGFKIFSTAMELFLAQKLIALENGSKKSHFSPQCQHLDKL